uniref:Uncharacterized protein n=1 Tax=Arundo donax TaxID=35708 RepID=A0A0A8ZBH5_ARUDO
MKQVDANREHVLPSSSPLVIFDVFPDLLQSKRPASLVTQQCPGVSWTQSAWSPSRAARRRLLHTRQHRRPRLFVFGEIPYPPIQPLHNHLVSHSARIIIHRSA